MHTHACCTIPLQSDGESKGLHEVQLAPTLPHCLPPSLICGPYQHLQLGELEKIAVVTGRRRKRGREEGREAKR